MVYMYEYSRYLSGGVGLIHCIIYRPSIDFFLLFPQSLGTKGPVIIPIVGDRGRNGPAGVRGGKGPDGLPGHVGPKGKRGHRVRGYEG